MRTAVLVAVGVVAVAVASVGAQPRPIAITRFFPTAGQVGVFVAAADGSGERPLLAAGDIDYNPVWSPDGASIVFTSDRRGTADLYRVRRDGTRLERLTNNLAYDDQAAFSPDGARIVFVSTRGGGTADLWVLDLRTRRATPLTSGPGGDFRPSWSPDGRWIAFSSDRGNPMPAARGRWERLQLADVYVIRPDGTRLRRLTARSDFCGSPKWTSDNRRLLAYCMTGEDTLNNRQRSPSPEAATDTRVVTIDVETGESSDVGVGPGVKMGPVPLPGNEIGYVRKDTAGGLAGIHYTNGARGPRGEVRTASWSPDGRAVVFHRVLPVPPPTWAPAFSRDRRFALTWTSFLPAFSPNGERFVMVSRESNGPAALLLAQTGSTAFHAIYQDKTRNVLAPQWSPRGDAVIFSVGSFAAFFAGLTGLYITPTQRVDGGAQVAIVNPDGTGYRELTTGPNNNGFPSIAPDGRRFVYRTFGTSGNGLRIMHLDTKAVTTLTEAYDNFPLWSPRGDRILFSRLADGNYEIYSIAPDGSALRRLTTAKGNNAHMGWSPDGEHIAFTASRTGFKDEAIYTDAPQPYGEIFVMRRDGTGAQQLTDNQWEEGTPAWQPVAAGPSRRR